MNKISLILLSLMLTTGVRSALACSPESKDCTMEKQVWINHISSFIPAGFCTDDSPFLQCYAVSQSNCIDITLTATKKCINEIESTMPKFLNKAESEMWGGVIGTCAGDKLTDKVKLKKGKSADCGTKQ